jgi:hypothetical protein
MSHANEKNAPLLSFVHVVNVSAEDASFDPLPAPVMKGDSVIESLMEDLFLIRVTDHTQQRN